MRKGLPAGFMKPCLPSPVTKPPADGKWLHEIKIDGFRLMPHRNAEGVRLITRHGKVWTDRFPAISAAIAGLNCATCTIDGEVAAPDENGIPSFSLLLQHKPAVLYAFDILELDGTDLRREPIEARKAALAQLLHRVTSPGITLCEYIEGNALVIYEHVCKLGYEGIVSKRAGSHYQAGRTIDWIKIKNPASAAAARDRNARYWNRERRSR